MGPTDGGTWRSEDRELDERGMDACDVPREANKLAACFPAARAHCSVCVAWVADTRAALCAVLLAVCVAVLDCGVTNLHVQTVCPAIPVDADATPGCAIAVSDIHIDPFVAVSDWWVGQVMRAARSRYGCGRVWVAGDMMSWGGYTTSKNVSDAWYELQRRRVMTALGCGDAVPASSCLFIPGNHDLQSDATTDRHVRAFGRWNRNVHIPGLGVVYLGGSVPESVAPVELETPDVILYHRPLLQMDAQRHVLRRKRPVLVLTGHDHVYFNTRHTPQVTELSLPTPSSFAALVSSGDGLTGFGVVYRKAAGGRMDAVLCTVPNKLVTLVLTTTVVALCCLIAVRSWALPFPPCARVSAHVVLFVAFALSAALFTASFLLSAIMYPVWVEVCARVRARCTAHTHAYARLPLEPEVA